MDPEIVHISTAHPPFDIRIFQKECRSLVKAGYRVGLVVPHDRDEARHGVRLYALKKRYDRMSRMLLGDISAFIKALTSGAKVFHLHDPELLPIGLLLKMCGKLVIYDAHEDLPRQILEKHWIHPQIRPFIAGVVEMFENFSVRCFDAVVAATPHIAERFSSKNHLTVMVNNFPSLQEMAVTTAADVEERSVCYVGAISQSRGLTEMMLALNYCDATLHLAGLLSPAELLGNIQASSAYQEGRVVYHGVLDREQVVQLLHKCSVGIVCFHAAPNHMYSQPTKLFEYMSVGMPIIASNFPYWRGIVEKNECGICVDPKSASEIGYAIGYLLDNHGKARQMGINGRKTVEASYSWEREEQVLLGLYRQLTCDLIKHPV